MEPVSHHKPIRAFRAPAREWKVNQPPDRPIQSHTDMEAFGGVDLSGLPQILAHQPPIHGILEEQRMDGCFQRARRPPRATLLLMISIRRCYKSSPRSIGTTMLNVPWMPAPSPCGASPSVRHLGLRLCEARRITVPSLSWKSQMLMESMPG